MRISQSTMSILPIGVMQVITIASVQVLQEAMDQAVESENYELAAKLRDEINRRNGAGNNL